MKISVITVNYNNKLGLRKTIKSVISQTYKDLEFIVIDGGSTDGSIDIIKEHETKINFWISELDNGIYHAMNKGIAKATGDYLLFLNSGDYFFENSVLVELIKNSNQEDLICGDIEYFNDLKREISKSPRKLSFAFFNVSTLPHPCTLIHKKLFTVLGLYKSEIIICADWAFF